MSSLDIDSRLRKVFCEVLDDPTLSVAPTLKMGDLEAWDSFSHINLMIAVESEFGVEFDSHEIGTLVSVGLISDALQKRLDPNRP
jgi:acyl carrier protein